MNASEDFRTVLKYSEVFCKLQKISVALKALYRLYTPLVAAASRGTMECNELHRTFQ